MGRKKSEFHNKDKVLQKTSVKSQSKSRPTKRPNSNKKESDEVDSLMFLRDLKNKKEDNGLDEKIKLLKSELKMLLGESKLESSHNKCVSSSGSGLLSQNSPNNKPLVLKPDIEIVGELNSKAEQSEKILQTKLSEWLDEISNLDSPNQKEFYQCGDSLLISNPQKGSTPERFSADECSSKLKCVNSSSQSQHKLENLLYKSFYLQNFETYLSSSDENDPDQTKSTKTLKQRKKRPRKSCKSSKEKLCQSSSSRSYRSSQRGRKKRRVARSLSKSNVGSTCNSASCIHILKEKNVECVDLDVTDYDWSEPFEMDENVEAFSDVEILENVQGKRADVSNQLKGTNSNPVEHDSSTISDLGKSQLKNAWECPICFETLKGQEMVATQCGHVFCKKCLERYMVELNKNCPTCRTDLSSKPIIPLFIS